MYVRKGEGCSPRRLQLLLCGMSVMLTFLCMAVMVVLGLVESVPETPTGPVVLGSSAPPGSFPTEGEKDNPFDDAAFLGDSVTLALRNHNLKTGALGNAAFLCAGSYSLRHAVQPGGVSVTWRGQALAPEQALQFSGARRVFILLGMNDLALGLEEALENYAALISNIRKLCPDMEIYIQSVTPIHPDFEGQRLNNANLDEMNLRLKSFAAKKGCQYLDIATVMKDKNGALQEQYCSDRQCHLTTAAVEVWLEKLKEVQG